MILAPAAVEVKPAAVAPTFRELMMNHLDRFEDECDAWYASPEGQAELERQAAEAAEWSMMDDGLLPF